MKIFQFSKALDQWEHDLEPPDQWECSTLPTLASPCGGRRSQCLLSTPAMVIRQQSVCWDNNLSNRPVLLPPSSTTTLTLKKELDLEITKINSWLTFFLKSLDWKEKTQYWLCRTTKRFWILEMKWCGTWNFLQRTLNLWVWGPCWLVLLAECHQPIILNNRKE